MKEPAEATFQVNADSDPVLLRIKGKANYLNCAPINRFFRLMIEKGNRRFVIDFGNCSGMDSTFLGIIAGTAITVRNLGKSAYLVLTNLNARNHELVENLGLHKLLTVDDGAYRQIAREVEEHGAGSRQQILQDSAVDEATMLKAHEALSSIDESNARKFQDVVHFLKEQVESGK